MISCNTVLKILVGARNNIKINTFIINIKIQEEISIDIEISIHD